MTTLPLRASDLPNVPHVWPIFARVAAVLTTVVDVLAEAARQANAAHKRLAPR
jgi:hypothetical protein